MSYNRLTDKDLIKNININQNQDLTPMIAMVKRLWELENAIEKGEDRKLLCNIGDTVYLVKYIFVRPDIPPVEILDEWVIDRIIIHHGWTMYCGTHEGTDDYRGFSNEEYGVEWFTDKVQAKQHLEELKEKKSGRV